LVGDDSPSTGQYYLTLCRLWQDITSRLGPITLIRREPPPIFPVTDLMEAEKSWDQPASKPPERQVIDHSLERSAT